MTNNEYFSNTFWWILSWFISQPFWKSQLINLFLLLLLLNYYLFIFNEWINVKKKKKFRSIWYGPYAQCKEGESPLNILFLFTLLFSLIIFFMSFYFLLQFWHLIYYFHASWRGQHMFILFCLDLDNEASKNLDVTS